VEAEDNFRIQVGLFYSIVGLLCILYGRFDEERTLLLSNMSHLGELILVIFGLATTFSIYKRLQDYENHHIEFNDIMFNLSSGGELLNTHTCNILFDICVSTLPRARAISLTY